MFIISRKYVVRIIHRENICFFIHVTEPLKNDAATAHFARRTTIDRICCLCCCSILRVVSHTYTRIKKSSVKWLYVTNAVSAATLHCIARWSYKTTLPPSTALRRADTPTPCRRSLSSHLTRVWISTKVISRWDTVVQTTVLNFFHLF